MVHYRLVNMAYKHSIKKQLTVYKHNYASKHKQATKKTYNDSALDSEVLLLKKPNLNACFLRERKKKIRNQFNAKPRRQKQSK